MSNAVLAWTLPTTRVEGEALPEAQIDFCEIQMSADGGANFSGVVQAGPAVLTQTIEDLNPGTYFFRCIVQDMDGRRSDHVEISGSILSAPEAVPSFTVTIE
jgi:hypothetical protein